MKTLSRNLSMLMLLSGICPATFLNAQNTVLGTGAGTGGNQNTNIGTEAGAANTVNGNVFVGSYSGYYNTTGTQNVFIGMQAGFKTTTGSNNTFCGTSAGSNLTTGSNNSFLGVGAGFNNLSGSYNTYLGVQAGFNATGAYNVSIGSSAGLEAKGNRSILIGTSAGYYSQSDDNTFVGNTSGAQNTTGGNNCFLGAQSGLNLTTGTGNTFIGKGAGINTITGSGNIFIGINSGAGELGSNKLYIANSGTNKPLIYGEFDNSRLVLNGKTGIGTAAFPTTIGGADISSYKLFVKGGILTDEIRVRTGWADYVFAKDYWLRPLSEVEGYISQNGHLPGVPTAEQVAEKGLELGDITRIQQEKLEELTLYIIGQNKRIEQLERRLLELKSSVK